MGNGKSSIVLGVALVMLISAAGCGQEIKKENEQLKGQVSTLQKENVDLKGQVTTLKADTEALKKQLDDLTKDKQELEDKLKAAEAKASAKPGTRPPLKPKKSS
jgi:predicted nuclease with TOPRIM domain